MRTPLLLVVVAVIVVAGLACAQRQVAAVAPPATPGSAHSSVTPAAETPSAVTSVGSADFDAVVLNAGGPVVVDFFATWCGPCKRLSPIIDQIASERAGKVKFVRLDVDESKDVASKYKVDAMPTLVLFDKGAEKTRWVGYMDKSELDSKLDGALKP